MMSLKNCYTVLKALFLRGVVVFGMLYSKAISICPIEIVGTLKSLKYLTFCAFPIYFPFVLHCNDKIYLCEINPLQQ